MQSPNVHQELETKLGEHRQALEKTKQLRQLLRDHKAIAQCESQIKEYEKSIEYLEEELCKRRFGNTATGSASPYADVSAEPSIIPQPNNGNRRYSRLDLMKSETPYNATKIAYKLQELEYKLDVETKLAAGLQRMMQVIEQDSAKLSDRRKSLAQKQLQESLGKAALLESARKRYKRLYIEDEQDQHSDDMVIVGNGMASAMTNSVSGYLQIRIMEARDLAHMPTRWVKSPDTVVIAKIDGKLAFESKPSRSCKWLEKHAVHINRASELELEIHDQAGDNRSPIGVLWINIMDVVEEMRKKKVQRQNTLLLTNESTIIFPEQRSSWSSSSPVSLSPLSALASSYHNYRNSLTPEPSSNESNDNDLINAWFDVEPQGEIHLELKFVRESPSSRPFNRLGRMGAVRERHNVVRDVRGHRFVEKKFYNVMKCAFCTEFLVKTGYQCEDCAFTCHEKCFAKVFTKCITKMNSEVEDEHLVSHRIPHKFAPAKNIGAHWCCHCGYVLPLGARRVEKCSECNVLCHSHCSHMVPDLCGAPPMVALNQMFKESAASRHRSGSTQNSAEEGWSRFSSSPTSFLAASESVDSLSVQVSDLSLRSNDRSSLDQFDPMTLRTSLAAQSIPHLMMPPPDCQRESASSSESSHLSAYRRLDEQLQRDNSTASEISSNTAQESEGRRVKIRLQDFTLLKVLGRGNFGKVILAQYQRTGEVYAIKVLKKRSALDFEDVQGIRIEKRVFQAANQERHPFLLNLHSCFQTHAHLCFVMEYVSGGDLMSHIQREPFSEKRAKFYACEVLCALEYFHQRGIIYRDLKLDNILLCKDGHIKLADYGLCKDNMWVGCTTSTFCGTPDFMAPEIILHQEYGQEVDWWAFGVLVYQMLLGMPPFLGEDDQEIAGAILNDDIMYPINMSRSAISLCKQLLTRDRSNRLTGAAAVKQHAFFKGVNWDDVLAKRVRPPFYPTVNSPTDTSNFDDEFTIQRPILTPIASTLTSAEQEEFAAFSYTAEWAM